MPLIVASWHRLPPALLYDPWQRPGKLAVPHPARDSNESGSTLRRPHVAAARRSALLRKLRRGDRVDNAACNTALRGGRLTPPSGGLLSTFVGPIAPDGGGPTTLAGAAITNQTTR